MSIPMSCNLGISGMAFVGSDTGGFGGNAQPEMLARWTQYGAFTPFFRNHAARGTIDQEPWAFGRRIRNICRAYTRLRYRLLPYIYSAFRQAVERGVPVQRPMIFGWPDDARFATESSQYMFGDHVLVAPILGAGERRRRVALPAGKWEDFHSGETFDGAAAVSADAPLDRMPLFVRGGAPLPMWEPAESTEWIDRSRLRVECYPGGAARTPLYEDDGETRNHARGEYAKILLETRQEEGRRLFSRGPTEGCYRVPGRTVEVVFVGCSAKPARVLLREGGVERRIAWRRTRRRGEVSVRVPDCDDGFSVVMEEGA
jgi:alpha-glucosidase